MFLPGGAHELQHAVTSPAALAQQSRERVPSSISWARLLATVFAIDVTLSRRCGGPMRVIAAVTDARDIAALLHGARRPPLPSPPGQLELLP